MTALMWRIASLFFLSRSAYGVFEGSHNVINPMLSLEPDETLDSGVLPKDYRNGSRITSFLNQVIVDCDDARSSLAHSTILKD